LVAAPFRVRHKTQAKACGYHYYDIYCPDTIHLKRKEIVIPVDIGPDIYIEPTGTPKYFGPDNINSTNRDPEVFRERENSETGTSSVLLSLIS